MIMSLRVCCIHCHRLITSITGRGIHNIRILHSHVAVRVCIIRRLSHISRRLPHQTVRGLSSSSLSEPVDPETLRLSSLYVNVDGGASASGVSVDLDLSRRLADVSLLADDIQQRRLHIDVYKLVCSDFSNSIHWICQIDDDKHAGLQGAAALMVGSFLNYINFVDC